MNKFKCINGWTRSSMIKHIETNFKGKSMDELGNCLYIGLRGTKCAVGMFIPNELYDDSIEGKSVRQFCYDSGDAINLLLPLTIDGMSQLQQVHDTSVSTRTLTNMLGWIKENVV